MYDPHAISPLVVQHERAYVTAITNMTYYRGLKVLIKS